MILWSDFTSRCRPHTVFGVYHSLYQPLLGSGFPNWLRHQPRISDNGLSVSQSVRLGVELTVGLATGY
jgi:hypothetical protein